MESVYCSKTKHVELYQLSFEYSSKQIELLNEIFKGKSYDVFRVRTSCQTTKIGQTFSKFGQTMSDHRLLLPALLQDGTFISIYNFKWPTAFIKDRVFSEPGLLLKKIRSTPFQDHYFLWPGHSLPDPVIPTNNELSLTCPRL